MLGLPMAIWYLIFLLFFVAVLFVGFKRPIYEVMALAFVFIVVITGRFDLFWPSLLYPSTSSLFYAIFAFLVVAVIFDETKVVERIINLIMSVVGRFRGGAGYVALLASTFMASLSGSGPGNVATTGCVHHSDNEANRLFAGAGGHDGNVQQHVGKHHSPLRNRAVDLRHFG